jgi:hypothetical protein
MLSDMKKLIVFCLMLTSITVFARSKHAPLPDAVLAAKTVYLVNETGDQGVTDGAYDAFTKWGRYSIAKSKESAEIVASFTSTGRLVEGTTLQSITMSIYRVGSQDADYQTTQRVHFRNQSKAAKSCVTDFQKRFEEAKR